MSNNSLLSFCACTSIFVVNLRQTKRHREESELSRSTCKARLKLVFRWTVQSNKEIPFNFVHNVYHERLEASSVLSNQFIDISEIFLITYQRYTKSTLNFSQSLDNLFVLWSLFLETLWCSSHIYVYMYVTILLKQAWRHAYLSYFTCNLFAIEQFKRFVRDIFQIIKHVTNSHFEGNWRTSCRRRRRIGERRGTNGEAR